MQDEEPISSSGSWLNRHNGNKQRAFSNLTGTHRQRDCKRSAGLAPAFLAVERLANQNVAVRLGRPPQRNLLYYHFLLQSW